MLDENDVASAPALSRQPAEIRSCRPSQHQAPPDLAVRLSILTIRPNLRFVVTNLDGEGQSLYDNLYCKRGECENRIKEQQLGLFADRTSCQEFVPNQLRVLLSAAAYILLQHLREKTLADTELAGAQVPTLRIKILKIGALIKRSARRIVLHLAGACLTQHLFRLIAAKLLPVVSSG